MTQAVAPGTPAAAAPPPPADGGTGGGDAFTLALAQMAGDGAPPPAPAASEVVAPAAPEVPKEEPAEIHSREFAALTAKKQRLKADREAHEANVKAFEAEKTAVATAKREHDERVTHARKNPLEALRALGWTYEQITKYVADNGSIPQEKLEEGLRAEFQAELAKIREERNTELKEIQTQREKYLAETREHQAKKFEADTAAELQATLAAEPDRYPYLSCVPAELAVSKAIEYQMRYFNQSGGKKTLALSDAMLYAEKEAKATADWFAKRHQSDPRREGAVQPANPGAQSVAPIPQSHTTVRGASPKAEELTDEQRWELAQRQMAGQ